MNDDTHSVLMEKLAALLREELNRDGELSVEGLGSFRVRHLPAQEKSWPNGRRELHPPEDEITFTPEEHT
jgi:nucleoid DNA-binding protein